MPGVLLSLMFALYCVVAVKMDPSIAPPATEREEERQ